jgi:cytochrome c oxidase subunit 4
MENKKEINHIVSGRVFIPVWVALVVLTAITVAAANMRLGSLSTITAIVIASIKAAIVLWFFMHLKYERRLFKILALLPIGLLALIIAITFLDIWYR